MGLIDDGITLQTLAEKLAEKLAEYSRECCEANKCTDETHNCESYAYIREDGQLLDVCMADYFAGCPRPHAAVSLPWKEDGIELAKEVDAQCEDMAA